MKLPCKVIEDILPLYHDEICSAESRELVDEHLKECEACRELLKKIDGDLYVSAKNSDDLKPLAGIRSEWLKVKKKSLVKGVLITAAAVLLLWGALFVMTDWKFIPVSTEKMEITGVSVLPEGTVAFHLLVDDGKEIRHISTDVDYDEGVVYLTPKRAILEQPVWFDSLYRSLNDRDYYINISPFTKAQTLDPANEEKLIDFYESIPDYAMSDYFFTSEITKICIGTEKDHIVLWEEGMELPAATAELEERYRKGIR